MYMCIDDDDDDDDDDVFFNISNDSTQMTNIFWIVWTILKPQGLKGLPVFVKVNSEGQPWYLNAPEVCRSLGVIVKRACWPFWSWSWTLCSPFPWGRSQSQKLRPEPGRFNHVQPVFFQKGISFLSQSEDWPCQHIGQREWTICSWWVRMMPRFHPLNSLGHVPYAPFDPGVIGIIGSKHESNPSAVRVQVVVSRRLRNLNQGKAPRFLDGPMGILGSEKILCLDIPWEGSHAAYSFQDQNDGLTNLTINCRGLEILSLFQNSADTPENSFGKGIHLDATNIIKYCK